MNHRSYLSPSPSQLHRAGKTNVCRIIPALLNNFPLKEATYSLLAFVSINKAREVEWGEEMLPAPPLSSCQFCLHHSFVT